MTAKKPQIPQAALEAGWQAILEGIRHEHPGAVVELVDAGSRDGPSPEALLRAQQTVAEAFSRLTGKTWVALDNRDEP